jgi:predicted ATP-grasp superfamily ATP-dependent carboligase
MIGPAALRLLGPRSNSITAQTVGLRTAVRGRSIGMSGRTTEGARSRVIITEDAPSYGVLACVRALRAGGYEPWVATATPSSYAARSRAHCGTFAVPDPADEAEAYAERLAQAAAELGAIAVLPGTDLALLALAGRESLFPGGVALGTCSRERTQRAMDKSELDWMGREAGLPAPPSRSVSLEDAQGDDLTYPVVLKPLRTISAAANGRMISVGVRRIESQIALRRAMASTPGTQWLVQPYLAGALEAVVGVAWDGRTVCAAHQVTERIYPADCGASAYARTSARDPGLERCVRRLIELLGWSGVFQVQILNTAQGRYVIDVNVRPYGSLALAVAAGLNLPTIWTDLLVGRPVHTDGYRVGVPFRSDEREAGALAVALVRGQWRTVASALRPRRHTVHAIFSIRDPLPALTSLRHVSKRLHLHR